MNFMILLLVLLGAAAALAIGAVCAVLWRGGAGSGKQAPPNPLVSPVPPAPRASVGELLARKFALEQQMAAIAGGQTGMFVLLDMIRNCPAGGDVKRYRDSYRSKQRKLRECVEEYRSLLGQAAGLPEQERARFVPEEDLDRYKMLMSAEV